MYVERLRAEPLRALTLLEAIVTGCAFVVDVAMSLTHFDGNRVDARQLFLYMFVSAVAASAVFSLPHRAHRRFAVVAAAILTIVVLAVLPAAAIIPAVLLFVLAARLTFAFGLRGTALAWIAAIVTIVATPLSAYVLRPSGQHIAEGIAFVLIYALIITLLLGMIAIMWLYARQGAAAAAALERTRIALDLHDSLGHTLTTLNVHLQNATSLSEANPQKARFYLERACVLAAEVLADVRESVTVLHDDSPIAFSIVPMLERLRDDLSAAGSIDVTWSMQFDREPDGRAAIVLYRVLQEALTNVIRHADAEHVAVKIAAKGGFVELSVTDDGIGLRANGSSGYGLTSMRDRVESLSGTFSVAGEKGTSVRARFPAELQS